MPRCAQNTDPTYYRSFSSSRRSNIRATKANAGLVNTAVICYSNAIFQCITSCIHLTDFLQSPSNEEHQHFELYHEFRSVMSSMVSGWINVINPIQFINLYRRHIEDFNADEGKYHDNWMNQWIYLYNVFSTTQLFHLAKLQRMNMSTWWAWKSAYLEELQQSSKKSIVNEKGFTYDEHLHSSMQFFGIYSAQEYSHKKLHAQDAAILIQLRNHSAN